MNSKLPFSGSKLIPIASPKGKERFCEVCQQVAYLQCTKCRVTFYCDADHQQADWAAIHNRICQLLVPIRTPVPVLEGSSFVENQLRKAELLDICRMVAQGKLSEGKHQEALLVAQFCLRCSTDVHGAHTVQMVPTYLLLAEANLCLGNRTLVAEHLSQAEWVVLKNPECGLSIRHCLHRSLGRLHTATGNLDEALFHFSNDIYLASEEYGLNSTVVCGGYFLIADVFVKQGKMPIVRSLYAEISNTWHSHLTKHIETQVQNWPNPDKFSTLFIDHSQQTEVDRMLRAILEFEQNNCRKDLAQIALVAHCLAMLWFVGGESQKAGGFASTALQASQLIPKHDLTEAIQGLLQLVQNQQTDVQPGFN